MFVWLRYSLGCPETKERETPDLGQREVNDKHSWMNFNDDSEISDNIRVEQGADELILTGSSTKDVPPKMLRSMLAGEFGDGSSNKLSGIGFHGIRVRTSPSSSGTFISFNCRKTSH
jgi:hypothetical protein